MELRGRPYRIGAPQSYHSPLLASSFFFWAYRSHARLFDSFPAAVLRHFFVHSFTLAALSFRRFCDHSFLDRFALSRPARVLSVHFLFRFFVPPFLPLLSLADLPVAARRPHCFAIYRSFSAAPSPLGRCDPYLPPRLGVCLPATLPRTRTGKDAAPGRAALAAVHLCPVRPPSLASPPQPLW